HRVVERQDPQRAVARVTPEIDLALHERAVEQEARQHEEQPHAVAARQRQALAERRLVVVRRGSDRVPAQHRERRDRTQRLDPRRARLPCLGHRHGTKSTPRSWRMRRIRGLTLPGMPTGLRRRIRQRRGPQPIRELIELSPEDHRYLTTLYDDSTPLPDSASELTSDSPRLKELRAAYAALDLPVTEPSRWSREAVEAF